MQKKKTLILFGLLLVQSIWASHTENPIDYVRPQIDEFGGWKKINSKKTLVKSRHIEGEEGGEYVIFNKLKNNQLIIKVAISYVNEEQAFLNLKEELNHWNFETVKQDSYDEWNRELGRKIYISKVSLGTANRITHLNYLIPSL